MTQRMMVRSFLVVLVSLSLLAAPAFAAGPAQPTDGPRSGWLVQFGDFLSRAVGLLFSDGLDERRVNRRDIAEGIQDDGPRSISANDDTSGSWDPDG